MPVTNSPLPTLNEVVLLAIIRGGIKSQQAIYHEYVRRVTHRITPQAVYSTLDRMRTKRLVKSWRDSPAEATEYTGPARVNFDITVKGEKKLLKAVGAIRG